MRKVLNGIEKLDGHYPGFLITVRGWLDKGYTNADIRRRLLDKYGVSVTRAMVENYRSKRWVPHKEKVDAETEALEAAYRACGGNRGLDLVAFARSRELIAKSDLKETLAVRLALVKIREQELKEEVFKFKTRQLTTGDGLRDAEDEGDAAAAKTARVVRKIKEIFGISPDPNEAPGDDPENTSETDSGDNRTVGAGGVR